MLSCNQAAQGKDIGCQQEVMLSPREAVHCTEPRTWHGRSDTEASRETNNKLQDVAACLAHPTEILPESGTVAFV